MSDSLDLDLLAAEYVLGTLEAEDAAEAARLLAGDASFAAMVHMWEERLAPLAASVAPIEPGADVWQRIVADIDGAAPRAGDPTNQHAAAPANGTAVILTLRRRVRRWQIGAGAAMALAASLAAFIVLRPAQSGIAVLMPMVGRTPVLLAAAGPHGTVTIRPDGLLDVPAGHDLELWELGAGATRPRSLGVLPASGARVGVRLAIGTQLLVSLEPRGGSPTGQPTGPVLYGGQWTTLDD